MTAPTLFAREDTMLGVCEGLGEETGTPATLFRVAFALGLFWMPVAMIAAYLVLGIALALFRWVAPFHRPAASSPASATWQRCNDDTALPLAAAA